MIKPTKRPSKFEHITREQYSYNETLKTFEKIRIVHDLKQTGLNVKQIAEQLKCTTETVRYKLRRCERYLIQINSFLNNNK